MIRKTKANEPNEGLKKAEAGGLLAITMMSGFIAFNEFANGNLGVAIPSGAATFLSFIEGCRVFGNLKRDPDIWKD